MTTSSRFLRRSALLNALFTVEGGSMFLLDVALAATLGLGIRSDSLYAAWGLPLTIGRGAFQSLTHSLIGLFGEAEDDRLAYSQAITLIGAIAVAAALLMSITSRWWFSLSLPGATAEARLAGAPLAAILSWLIAPLALAETQRAVYYRLGKNVIPSVARVLGTSLSVILILLSAREQNLALVAYGLVCGAAAEMLIGFAGLFTMGHRFTIAWPPADVLRRMTRVVGFPLLGQIVFIISGTAERALASFLGPGTLTAITYATRIFQMLERFVFRGFVITTIQEYAASALANWRRDMRLLLLLSIPLTVVFAVLPTAVITIFFERGRFTAESSQLVGLALRTYAFAIPIVAFSRIPYALAFARNKSRELLTYSVIYALALLGSEILLISLGVGAPAFGIAQIAAFATSTAWLYPRVMRGLNAPAWSVEEIARLLGVGVFVFTGTVLVVDAVQGFFLESTLVAWLTVLVGVNSSLLLIAAGAWIFRLPEIARFSRLLRKAGH
jgi:putative peptidoglycan lipid II flippase